MKNELARLALAQSFAFSKKQASFCPKARLLFKIAGVLFFNCTPAFRSTLKKPF
jgi:hypothetical protein